MVLHELWDSRSNNLVATFDSKSEALAVLHDILREQGEFAFEYLMLIEDNVEVDESNMVAMGLELADLARNAA